MIERTFTLTNASGLHARPASALVRAVQQYPGTEVYLRKGEREASGRSLLSVLGLGISKGDAITIRCEGPQESEAMMALAALVEGGFGE